MQEQNRPLILSEEMREVLRLEQYSLRSEETYLRRVRILRTKVSRIEPLNRVAEGAPIS
jgi:hypothetical protein